MRPPLAIIAVILLALVMPWRATGAPVDDKKPGNAPITFRAFDPGTAPFYQVVETTTTQTMTVMGQKIDQTHRQTVIVKWTPQPRDEKGNHVAIQETVGLQMDIDIGGNKLAYDSRLKNKKGPLADFFDPLRRQPLTLVIDRDLHVVDVKGLAALQQRMAQNNTTSQQLVKTFLSREAIARQAEPLWLVLPPRAVARGDAWDRHSVVDLGPIGKYQTNYLVRHEGTVGGRERVNIRAALQLLPPPGPGPGGLPFAIKNNTIAGTATDGAALLDRRQGCVASYRLSMKLVGQMTIAVGTLDSEIAVDQSTTTSSQVHARNPWDEGK